MLRADGACDGRRRGSGPAFTTKCFLVAFSVGEAAEMSAPHGGGERLCWRAAFVALWFQDGVGGLMARFGHWLEGFWPIRLGICELMGLGLDTMIL